jgi:two-component system, chemotaxis family, chemotaxis protein CheY
MDGYGKRILVVDDDDEVRLCMSLLLEDAGYNVIPVCDGLDALHEMKRRHFDAVITDYAMPILNGLELLGCIHAMHPEMPVILVSATVPDYSGALKDDEFFACLRKPFENALLLELVREAVQLPQPTYTVDTSPSAAK